MELQKNKKRAQRRQRNYIAKQMHEKKRGGPMSDKKRQIMEEIEKQWMEEAHEVLDQEASTDGE